VQLIRFGEGQTRTSAPPRRYRGPLDEGRPPIAWRSMYLACGHITTPEEQELHRLWKPRKGLYRCEQCHEWTKAVDWFTFYGVERPADTTEPLF
jgi:hypothetical protein